EVTRQNSSKCLPRILSRSRFLAAEDEGRFMSFSITWEACGRGGRKGGVIAGGITFCRVVGKNVEEQHAVAQPSPFSKKSSLVGELGTLFVGKIQVNGVGVPATVMAGNTLDIQS